MRKITALLLLALAALTGACEGENENPNSRTGTGMPFSRLRQTEDIHESGVPTVTTSETFLYNNVGRLTELRSTQSYTLEGEQAEMGSTTTVTYADREAVVTDEAGNVSTYLFNEKGYAVQCTRQEVESVRMYTFDYDITAEGIYRLKSVIELVDGVEYSSIALDYDVDGTTLHIVHRIDTFRQTYTASTLTEDNNRVENLSQLPCLFLAELHPLILHTAALYGKLLGEPSEFLIAGITPDANAESNETTRYQYALDAQGFVTSCEVVTHSYGSTYTRDIDYDFDR